MPTFFQERLYRRRRRERARLFLRQAALRNCRHSHGVAIRLFDRHLSYPLAEEGTQAEVRTAQLSQGMRSCRPEICALSLN